MNVIYSGRQTGRTARLIERAAELEAEGQVVYIVCLNRNECTRIFNMAKEMGKKIRLPISFGELRQGMYAGKNIDSFLIDNADYLLQSMLPVHVDTLVVEKANESP